MVHIPQSVLALETVQEPHLETGWAIEVAETRSSFYPV